MSVPQLELLELDEECDDGHHQQFSEQRQAARRELGW